VSKDRQHGQFRELYVRNLWMVDVVLGNKIKSFNTRLLVIAYYIYICTLNIVIPSLVHHVRPDHGLIKNGRNMLSIF